MGAFLSWWFFSITLNVLKQRNATLNAFKNTYIYHLMNSLIGVENRGAGICQQTKIKEAKI